MVGLSFLPIRGGDQEGQPIRALCHLLVTVQTKERSATNDAPCNGLGAGSAMRI